jgi:hypothetical protein
LIRFITGRTRETKFSTVPRGSPSPPDIKNSYRKWMTIEKTIYNVSTKRAKKIILAGVAKKKETER